MDILKILKLEKLYRSKELDEYILNNTRFIIPGYKYNYRLCTFRSNIEFERCETKDGHLVSTDVHFAGHTDLKLVADDKISYSVSAPFCKMHHPGTSNVFPVRIVCPDVLADVECGEVIEGQVAVLADSIEKQTLSSEERTDVVFADRENFIKIYGKVSYAWERKFEFGEISEIFTVIDLDTEFGEIPVLINKRSMDFEIDLDDELCVHGVFSLDVALEREANSDGDDAEESTEPKFKNGFIPSYENARKVLVRSLRTGDLERFVGCCAEEIAFMYNNCDFCIERTKISKEMQKLLPGSIEGVEIKHILSCKYGEFVGKEAILVITNENASVAIAIETDCNDRICKLMVVDTDKCSLGIDYELHLLTMLSYAMCKEKPYLLKRYLSDGCLYRSEYADVHLVGVRNIVARFEEIAKKIKEQDKYTYEIAYAKDELRSMATLPKIYGGTLCSKQTQNGKLAYICFIQFDDTQKINNILLSRDPAYLKAYKNSQTQETTDDSLSLPQILGNVYGFTDTIEKMRTNAVPDYDENGVYIWKHADRFAIDWLYDNLYEISETVLTDDCLGYTCNRKGVEYAVFFYAYGKKQTVQLDGDYCSKLRNEKISQGRNILIVYVQVATQTNEDGETEYKVFSFGGEDHAIEPWLLTTVNGKNILRFYPDKESMDIIPRLIAGFNTLSLDILQSICTSDAVLEDMDEHMSLNDGFYSHLAYLRQAIGPMQLAYIRFNDVVYSAVPYIENYAYIGFSSQSNGLINKITLHDIGKKHRELILTDDFSEQCDMDNIPHLIKADFLDPSEGTRYSVMLTFENGEVRRYDLNGDFEGAQPYRYQQKAFTDKMFKNGRISEHIPRPTWIGYNRYSKRGQGIEFINGATISTIELYTKSHPVENFSFCISDVFLLDDDYDKNGNGVGRLKNNKDPKNPLYLFNKNTLLATALPEKYQNTPICYYPFVGGGSEGYIMVSEFGDIDLQYHHNRSSCAGRWGWLDKDMNTVITPKYVYAMNFENGRAIVCKGDWSIIIKEGKEQHWCDNEQWGVIDKDENEIVPCRFDELYEVENTNRLYFVHEGGWEEGSYGIFDTVTQTVILKLDFDFDMGYMFNNCYVENDILIFVEHLPGEGKDLIYAYDLHTKEYLAHAEEYTERTLNGEKKIVVHKDGKDIIVF